MARKLCAIIGFDPGLGTADAETFKDAGDDLGLLSRSGADLGGTECILIFAKRMTTVRKGGFWPARRCQDLDVQLAQA
ncbi:MAG: hypothetical protein KJO30_07450 [Boseongicola sp.]|nr:hypothetical protein [Boseongicola sp.]